MSTIYEDGTYLERNPTWHEEDAEWKASKVAAMLSRHSLNFGSLVDVGCGTGGVLRALQADYRCEHEFTGADISFDALEKAREHTSDIPFVHWNVTDDHEMPVCRIATCLDVIEHVPDYHGVLHNIRSMSKHQLYHIPLEISSWSAWRDDLTAANDQDGHIHYFTRETALRALLDTGHEIIDWEYTAKALELYHLHPKRKTWAMNWLRRCCTTSFAARVLGGYSLLVLTK